MTFLEIYWKELLIGVIGSLLASLIVGFISLTKKWPPIPIPAWVLVLAVGVPISFGGIYYFQNNESIPIVDLKFESERVFLDGKKFIRCSFDRCNLIFKGEKPFGVEGCNFSSPKFIFEGSAATTLFQLKLLKNDPTFAKVIEESLLPLEK